MTKSVVTAEVAEAQEKFSQMRRDMNTALLERETETDLLLTAVIAQEHFLMVGPPGNAKSLMLDMLMAWIDGPKFRVTLNAFTEPDELFGPIDLEALQKGERTRNVTRKMPAAVGVFIDEIFKGSPSLLNSLLGLLESRTYDNGRGPEETPLRVAVAGSNEWPAAESSLGALFDRFLFRIENSYVQQERSLASLRDMHFGKTKLDRKPAVSTRITLKELDLCAAAAVKLPITDEAKDRWMQIMLQLKSEGISPSDRRKAKSMPAAQAAAFLAGSYEVRGEHLDVLSSVLWTDPVDQPKKVSAIIDKSANEAKALENEVRELRIAFDLKKKSIEEVIAQLSDIRERATRLTGGRRRVTLSYIDETTSHVKLEMVKRLER